MVRMTVGELIARLQNYHDKTPVLVDGYEDGFDEIAMRLLRVSRVSDVHWWSGLYEENVESGIEALILQRTHGDD